MNEVTVCQLSNKQKTTDFLGILLNCFEDISVEIENTLWYFATYKKGQKTPFELVYDKVKVMESQSEV